MSKHVRVWVIAATIGIAVAVPFFVATTHHADSVEATAHAGWHKTIGTIKLDKRSLGEFYPEHQLASVTYRLSNGSQTSHPALVDLNIWTTGDQLQMQYSDNGGVYIPASTGSSIGRDPFPVRNQIETGGTLLGMAAGILAGLAVAGLQLCVITNDKGSNRRRLVAA